MFASGRGSNARAILEHIDRGRIDARIRCIISNKEDAGIFALAEERNIPKKYLNPAEFESEDTYADAVTSILDAYGVGLIVLAGYLRKIPATVISRYQNRIMNIHPALLPAFGGKGMYGMRVHQAVIDYGVKLTGVTVHFVDEEYDHGPIILQKAVPVLDNDTAESLAERVLEVEHHVYSEAIALYAEERIMVKGRRVYIKQ